MDSGRSYWEENNQTIQINKKLQQQGREESRAWTLNEEQVRAHPEMDFLWGSGLCWGGSNSSRTDRGILHGQRELADYIAAGRTATHLQVPLFCMASSFQTGECGCGMVTETPEPR